MMRIPIIILLVMIGLFSSVYDLSADNPPVTTQKIVNSEYVAYTDFLRRLDSANPSSILLAKNELLTRFREKTDESGNDAFRAFSKFYSDTISRLDNGFSSKPYFQEALSKIAEATGLDNNPFPAFDKLDNTSAREIKQKYASALKELYQYRKAGINFGQSEGTWYLQGDPDFFQDASSVTTGEYKEYLRFNAEECKQNIVEDGGILVAWDELRKRIIREENFAKQHPNLPETEKNIKGSMSWLMDVYLTGIDNSSVDNHGVRLDPEIRDSYEMFLKENSSSQYYNIVRDVYAIWTKNDFKTSRELVDYLREKGHGRFIYMLGKGLPKNQRGSTVESNLQSRIEGSVSVPSVLTTNNQSASSPPAEVTISLTYGLIICLIGLVFILGFFRIRAKKK